MLKHSSVEKSIIAQVQRSGGKLPDNIANAPEVREDLTLYWRAFWDLCSCRTQPTQQIQWTDVQFWADTYKLEPGQTEGLHFLIRELDQIFLVHVREKIKQEQKTNGVRDSHPQRKQLPK